MNTQKRRLCLTKLKRPKLHPKPILSEVGVVGGEGIKAWNFATVSQGQNQQLLKLGMGQGQGRLGGNSTPKPKIQPKVQPESIPDD